ncbi:MAG: gliding motility-associated ABC transporter substrate-binding protein GldG [Bacteroidetes bacterium]|nr:gliding motility-associated ABC transporter substrate-binding protein GldG [Bacteroidota bacterium]
MRTKRNKRSDIINLFLGLVIIVLLNVASQYYFVRFDLTQEKRYTLAPTTKQMLKDLDDIVYFKVYLEGDFPQGAGDFKHLRDEARIMLDEFRAYGGDRIAYEFIDPNENPNPAQRTAFQTQLEGKGLKPHSEPFVDDKGAETVMKLYPWAIASYKGKEVKIPLLGTNMEKSDEEIINHAVEGLEYEFTNAIRKLQMRLKPKIAITQGHGEADTLQLRDLVNGLREYYDVDFVPFHNNLGAFRDTMQDATQIVNKYSAIIVDSPDSVFTAQELFILDQFIMYGGKALFLVDPVYTDIDSLAATYQTLAMPRKLGLEDLTFRYGARMNTTLVQDLYCSDLVLPMRGGQYRKVPWVYSPTILPLEDHPIVRNLDRIKFDFLSTIDTVGTTTNVKKTILLKSSDKSRFMRTPAHISIKLAILQPPDQRMFDKPDQSVAVLLEGNFDSYYKNKFLPDTFKNSKIIGYKQHSIKDSKIIVVGDGEVAMNPVKGTETADLGYDLMNYHNPVLYANKTFLLNCVNYLCDDKGMLALRSREVTLRLLDRGKIKDHRLKWQLINTLAPVFIIILIGLYRAWMRKQKYVFDKNYRVIDTVIVSFAIGLILFFFVKLWVAFIVAIIYSLIIVLLHNFSVPANKMFRTSIARIRRKK